MSKKPPENPHGWKPASVMTYALSEYPSSYKEFSDLAKDIYEEDLYDQIRDPDNCGTITFFMTSARDLPQISPPDAESANAPGRVIVFHNLPEDMIFYMVGVLKADAFVRLMEEGTYDGAMVVAFWYRMRGVEAFGREYGTEKFVKLPCEMVSHILPRTIRNEEDHKQDLH